MARGLPPLDQYRFRAALDSVLDQRRGRLVKDFPPSTPDGLIWFALKARPVSGSDGEFSRVVGTLTDVTEQKNAEIGMLPYSVADNLTVLPNRKLFHLDRLGAVRTSPRTMPNCTPDAEVIDLDRFNSQMIPSHRGRRLLLLRWLASTRILKPQDTLPFRR